MCNRATLMIRKEEKEMRRRKCSKASDVLTDHIEKTLFCADHSLTTYVCLVHLRISNFFSQACSTCTKKSLYECSICFSYTFFPRYD